MDKQFSALVRECCKRIEKIRDDSEFKKIEVNTRISLLKYLIKELTYESKRQIIEQIDSYSNGTKINVNLIRPDSAKE